MLAEGLQEGFGMQESPLQLVASDFVKSVACLALWVIQSRTSTSGSFRELPTEEQPLNDMVPLPDDEVPDDNDLDGWETRPSSTSTSLDTENVGFRSVLVAVLLGAIFALRTLVVGLGCGRGFVSTDKFPKVF